MCHRTAPELEFSELKLSLRREIGEANGASMTNKTRNSLENRESLKPMLAAAALALACSVFVCAILNCLPFH